MGFKREYAGLLLLLVTILSISAVWIARAANDTWESNAATDWYNADYQTYTIDTPAKLAGVAKLVNSGVTDFDRKVLEVSVNLNLGAHNWQPIGSQQHPFRGTLLGKSGQMIQLSGLTIQNDTLKHIGLIGYMRGATVGGFRLSGSIETNTTDPVAVGAAVGCMDQDSTVFNVINDASIRVTSAQNAYVGGIIGQGAGLLSNVTNNGDIVLNAVARGVTGGIAGASDTTGLTLKKTTNTGGLSVTGSVYEADTGGIVGLAQAPLLMAEENTSIRNAGLIKVQNAQNASTGGMLGKAAAGAPVSFSKLSANTGNIDILSPEGSASFAGGLVGLSEQPLASDIEFQQNGTITHRAGRSVYTGGVTGLVYGDFTWGGRFLNEVPILVSGTDRVYTGGVVGQAAGAITFRDIAQNIAPLQVTSTGDGVYTGGLAGHAGQRLVFENKAAGAYQNTGSITVNGKNDLYTGGITADRAYTKTADNVSSSGEITVTGTQRIFTGGFTGQVNAGGDADFSNESFGSRISVTAATDGGEVYTGGIVGSYASDGVLHNLTFTGDISVTGGSGAATGGIAGSVSGGTVVGATVGRTADQPARITSDGHVGGVVGALNGSVSSAAVKYISVSAGGSSGSTAGAVAGRAQGVVSQFAIGAAEAKEDTGVQLAALGPDAKIGGLFGANDGPLEASAGTVSHIMLKGEAAAHRAKLGGIAGLADAEARLGKPGAPLRVQGVTIEAAGAETGAGGVVGENHAELTHGAILEASGISIVSRGGGSAVGGWVGVNQGTLTGVTATSVSIHSEGAAARIGGIAGYTRGSILNARAYATETSPVQLTASGKDSAVGGIAGAAEQRAVQGNGKDANASGLRIDASAEAVGANVGGLVGFGDKLTIQGGVAENVTLTVRGAQSASGGLIGVMKESAVKLSAVRGILPDYALLSVLGADSDTGGLAGRAERSALTGNSADYNVANTLLVADIGSAGVRLGGLVGTNLESGIDSIFAQNVNITAKTKQAIIGGFVGVNQGTETSALKQNWMEALSISVPASASSPTVGGMIGRNEARSGQADAAPAEKAISTVQRSRIAGKLNVRAQHAVVGGLVGDNRSILANNSMSERLPILADGPQGTVGGLVGKNTGTLFYVYSNAALTVGGEGTVAGGLAGENTGKIIASYIETDLTGQMFGTDANYALLGGLVGRNAGSIDKSFTSAKVTGSGAKTYVGGLVGAHTGTIQNSYAAKEVTASGQQAYAGGLVGVITTGRVSGSYSAGQVNGQNGGFAGAFAGYYNNDSKTLIDNTYYVKDDALGLNRGLLDFGGGTYYELNQYSRLSPILSASLADRAAFPQLSGWTFNDTAWRYGSPNAAYKYPELNLSANTGETPGSGSSGGGTGGEPGGAVNMNINWYTKKPSALRFVLQSEADLAGLAAIVNGTVTGLERFDFKGREIELAAPIHIQSKQWTPIGLQEQTPFEGAFHGKNQLISGLQVSSGAYSGLFGVLGAAASVQDAVLEPVSVQGTGYAGALAGVNKGGVSRVQVTLSGGAKVSGGAGVGGVLGKNTGTLAGLNLLLQDGAQISSEAANAAVGGLIGDNAAELRDSAAVLTKGKIEAAGEQASVGGLFGRQTGAVAGLSVLIDAEAAVQATGRAGIAGGLAGVYISGPADHVSVTLNGFVRAAGQQALAGGVIGRSERGQTARNMHVNADEGKPNGKVYGAGIAGGVFGEKTGQGVNAFDAEDLAVKRLELGTGDNGSAGGVAGKLSHTAVRNATFEGTLPVAASGASIGGIVGQGYNSILYKVSSLADITLDVAAGDNAVGGIAGSMESSSPDTAFDFGYLIPLYHGMYEANVAKRPIAVNGSGIAANVYAGGIVGKLKAAAVYTSATAADLRAIGLKTAVLGGVAGYSDGRLIHISAESGIAAEAGSDYRIGGIAGQTAGGKVAYAQAKSPNGEHIVIGDSISSARVPTMTQVGGVVGLADGTAFEKVSANLPVEVKAANPYNTIYAGGFAGLLGDSAHGSIAQASAMGSVTASGRAGAFVGGFAGTVNRYAIREASAYGSVADTAFDARGGGFAGAINAGSTIEDAYASPASVAITGAHGATRAFAGGFAGYNDGALTRVYERAQSVSAQAGGSNSYMGALIGYNFRDGRVAKAYYAGDLPPIKYAAGGTAQDVRIADFSRAEAWEGWDFSKNNSIWGYAGGADASAPFAPVLLHTINWSFAPDLSFLSRMNKGETAFRADTGAQLAGIALLYNEPQVFSFFDRQGKQMPAIQTIELGADIHLSGKTWRPIAEFKGRFDGANHVISGLTVKAGAESPSGLIARNYGVLTHVTFAGADVIGGDYTGIAAGTNEKGASLARVTVSRSKVQGVAYTGGVTGRNEGTLAQVSADGVEVKGADFVGGVAGANGGSLTDATVRSLGLTGQSSVGGITGLNTGVIEQASAKGTINAAGNEDGSAAGGIAGHNAGRIAASFTKAAIRAQAGNAASAGGIAGKHAAGASIEQSFSYSVVIADASDAFAGGIAGDSQGLIASGYHSGTAEARGLSSAVAGGIAGRTVGGAIRQTVHTGQVTASVNGVLVPGKTRFGGAAGQIDKNTVLEANYYDTQMLQQPAAYFNAEGRRVKEVPGKAVGLKTVDLTNGALPSGLSAGLWQARPGFYPQLARFAGMTDSELAATAVILGEGDTAYRVKGSYQTTQDPSIAWTAENKDSALLITAAKQGEGRSMLLNRKPVLYAETAAKPAGPAGKEFKGTLDAALTTQEPEGVIYFTLDGREPTESAAVYTKPITLNATTTIKAIVAVEGKNNSEPFTATYTKFVPSPGGGGGGGGMPEPGKPVELVVNGKSEAVGVETTVSERGALTSTIALNEPLIDKLLAQQGQGADITIPFKTVADSSVGEFSGELAKKLEAKQATLRLQTEKGFITVPAEQLHMDSLAAQLGQKVPLHEIKVRVEMLTAAQEASMHLAQAAKKGGYSVAATPVAFKVTYTYGRIARELPQFDHYVERGLPIPSDAASDAVTTGVLVEPDGSVTPAPTKIKSVNGKRYAVVNSLSHTGSVALVQHTAAFRDIESHWGRASIQDMGSRLIVGGVGDGLFQPDRHMTRAEFATVIVTALGLKAAAAAAPFSDVKETDWYASSIRAAQGHGLISGYDNGSFGPNDTVSREQAMIIISRAMTMTGLTSKPDDVQVGRILGSFGDTDQISEYAKAGIAAGIQAGLVSGQSDNRLAPLGNISRAEVSAMIQRLLQKSGFI